jgi:hypothetical protein
VEGGEGFGGSSPAEEREDLRWSANASVEASRWSGGAGTSLRDAPHRTDRKRGASDNAVIAVEWLLNRRKLRFFQGQSDIGEIDVVDLFLSLLLGVKEAQYRRAD